MARLPFICAAGALLKRMEKRRSVSQNRGPQVQIQQPSKHLTKPISSWYTYAIPSRHRAPSSDPQFSTFVATSPGRRLQTQKWGSQHLDPEKELIGMIEDERKTSLAWVCRTQGLRAAEIQGSLKSNWESGAQVGGLALVTIKDRELVGERNTELILSMKRH